MYEFVEHTGDVKIRAKGKDIRELLEELGKALVELMNERGEKPKEEETWEGSSEGETLRDLIVNFLSDVLSMCEAEEVKPARVEVKEVREGEKWRVKYKIIGEKGTPGNIVKAITYHQLKVEVGREAMAEVVVDV